MRKIDRVGEENFNNKGTLMKIVIYNNCDDMYVEFQDKYRTIVHAKYKDFKNGCIKNPYDKSVYNIGYLGVGEYSQKRHTKIYDRWADMLCRCYEPYYLNRKPSYINCYVCEAWHCFQNFAKWWEENCSNKEEDLCLDKDILKKGNKIYSPDTCILVPHRINELFTKREQCRGNYPMGVSYHKPCNKFRAYCHTLEGQKYLGLHNTVEEAFYAYKIFKELYIKQVADEYKDLIPQELYNAMYNYEVEIND